MYGMDAVGGYTTDAHARQCQVPVSSCIPYTSWGSPPIVLWYAERDTCYVLRRSVRTSCYWRSRDS